MKIKFISSSTALLSRLQAISRVIKTRNTMPVLDCFLFNIEGNTLKIVASDLETTMETSIELETVTGEGNFAISAKMMLDTLNEFPEQPLTFIIDTETLGVQILSENGKFSIVGQRADTFPVRPRLGEKHGTLKLRADLLRAGINKTYFATTLDDLRPAMNGIFFDIKTDSLTFVASDSHKLVQIKALNVTSAEDTSFILPKKPADLLRNVLPKESAESEVVIEFDEKNIYFQLNQFKMACRVIDAKFPNYKSVIPTDNVNKLTIDRISFMTSLKRVNVFSNQASNLVKLAMKENEITISAQDIDFSTSATENLVCQYTGTPLNIGFKSTFLLEMLQNIDTAEVVIAFGDHTRPGLIFPLEQKADEDILMLLTALSLNE